MAGAEALPGAVNRREGFLREFGAVKSARRVEAVVAIAAGRGRFAEIGEQAHAAAAGGFGEADQGVKLLAGDAFVDFLRFRFVDHAPLRDDVGQAVGHPRVGGCAIAPGAASLLIIGFDVAWQIEMGDEAHVRFVDAHAKGDGGGND